MSVYNGEKYLEQAVASILNQTFRDFEFIIINDGSTDSSLQILESYTDPRLYIINQENIGLTKSLNKGINIANGKYIARMDSDDVSLPNRLEKQVAYLDKNKDTICVGCLSIFIDSRNKIINYEQLSKKLFLNELLPKGNAFSHGSAMFRRRDFLNIGGYREFFTYVQDYDLWLRMLHIGRIAIINNYLYRLRITKESISVSKSCLQNQYADIARKLYQIRKKGMKDTPVLKKYERQISKQHRLFEQHTSSLYHYTIGKEFLKSGNVQNSVKHMRKAFQDPRFFLPSIFYLCISLLPKSMILRVLELTSIVRPLIYKLITKSMR